MSGPKPWQLAVATLAVALWSSAHIGAQPAPSHPFEYLAPSIVVSAEDRARLDRGQVLVRTLPARDGRLAVFAASRVSAAPELLILWTRAIAELKRSRFVQAVGRFSDPPLLGDLDALELDARDLDAIRRCRPGACGLKLSAGEIASLTGVAAQAGVEWREAVQQEFRRLLLQRVERYRAGGLTALPPPADRRVARHPADALAGILEESPYLSHFPSALAWLQGFPRTNPGIESFFYWSKEQYGDGKPVIAVTHVGIVHRSDHPAAPVAIVGKQIYATHYLDGSLGLTMIVGDAAEGARYLVYVNRSHVDVVKGVWGGIVRSVFEDRLRRHAPEIVDGLRRRLESGPPRQGIAQTIRELWRWASVATILPPCAARRDSHLFARRAQVLHWNGRAT